MRCSEGDCFDIDVIDCEYFLDLYPSISVIGRTRQLNGCQASVVYMLVSFLSYVLGNLSHLYSGFYVCSFD